jgi:hypothetical protein
MGSDIIDTLYSHSLSRRPQQEHCAGWPDASFFQLFQLFFSSF